MFGIALTLGAKKIFPETHFKEMCDGTGNKRFQFKGLCGKAFYRGKTFGKDCSMKKIPDGTQNEIKQETDNVKDKLHLKINIHSYEACKRVCI